MKLPILGPAAVVYQDPYQRISKLTADFGAYTKEYFVTAYGTRAAVVVVRGDDVLLCRQYRMLRREFTWEIPGGKVEEGETADVAALRECREETGIRCHRLKPLITFQPGSDIIDNPTHIFYATQCTEEGERLDQRDIEPPVWRPLSRCLEMIFTGEITDGLTVVSLLAYDAFRNRNVRSAGEVDDE